MGRSKREAKQPAPQMQMLTDLRADLYHLPLDRIDPSPYQHRRAFASAKLEELKRSIERDGLIEPIVVRVHDERFELIAGERRVRACRLCLTTTTILARVVEVDDLTARRMCAAENLQREDLSAVETVGAVVEMVDAELIEEPEYAAAGETPADRVKWLLGRLASVDELQRRGSEVSASAIGLFNKFVKHVERIFASLPRPVEWRAFYNHDLPLVTRLDPAVREWAIANKLNKSQTKALANLEEKAPTLYQALVQGADDDGVIHVDLTALPSLGDEEGEELTLSDISARQINDLARTGERDGSAPWIDQHSRGAGGYFESNGAAPAELTVKPGEWWRLGPHLLYCGDTSEPAFWERLPVATFAFADPPYNVGAAEWDCEFVWRHDWLANHGGSMPETRASLADLIGDGQGIREDFERIQALVGRLEDTEEARQRWIYLNEAACGVVTLLTANWSTVEALAAALRSAGTLQEGVITALFAEYPAAMPEA